MLTLLIFVLTVRRTRESYYFEMILRKFSINYLCDFKRTVFQIISSFIFILWGLVIILPNGNRRSTGARLYR